MEEVYVKQRSLPFAPVFPVTVYNLNANYVPRVDLYSIFLRLRVSATNIITAAATIMLIYQNIIAANG